MHKAVKSSKSAFVFFGKSAVAFLLIPIFLLLISSCGGSGEKGNEPKSEYEVIAEIMESMTLEDKAGQLIIGRCPDENDAEEMNRYHLGGYTFYTTNFNRRDGSWFTGEEVREHLRDCRGDLTVPPLFAVDEEGGTVTRLSENPEFFPGGRSKSPRDILSEGGMEALEKDTTEKSKILKKLGFHVNFAPVADMSTEKNACMYSRSIGGDVDEVCLGVSVAVKAMDGAGIEPVLKHFPGYGNNEDTHEGMVVDKRPYEEYADRDYKPFQAGIDAGCEAVMMEHIRVESMDAERPASLSSVVVSELRDKLGFDGVIMTDDLSMGEMAEVDKDGHVAVEAIEAGNDMVISSRYRESYESLLSSIKSGELSNERLDESVKRIIKWKIHMGIINE